MLLPFQGEPPPNQSTQGVALGWVLIGLSGRYFAKTLPDTNKKKYRLLYSYADFTALRRNSAVYVSHRIHRIHRNLLCDGRASGTLAHAILAA